MISLTLLLWLMSLCQNLNAQFPYRQWHHRPEPIYDTLPKFSMVLPSLLRVGNKENIILEASGLSGPVDVSLNVYDFPRKSSSLWQGTATLSSDNNYNLLKTIEISPNLLHPEEKVQKLVYLVAQFGEFQRLEQLIKVSFLSGYIFIQTDKPIFNPGDTDILAEAAVSAFGEASEFANLNRLFLPAVRWRAFASTPDFHAFSSTISAEIQNPDGITVYASHKSRAVDGIYSDTFALSDLVKEGTWKIVAKFDHWKENTFTTPFEVKKYELPAFNVTLVPKKSHLSLEDQELEVEVFARYLYGEQVEGVAYVVFGIERNAEKTRLPLMKQVKNLKGGTVTLTMKELKDTYPDIRSLVGSSIYVKASVMTSSGSDLVEAEKTGIRIVLALHTISFKDTPRFFKPGLPFDLTVKVSHHDGSPAPNIPVQINFLSSPVTVHGGTIKASFNMPSSLDTQLITVRTVVPDAKDEQQASESLRVYSYMPSDRSRQNYLYISVDKSAVKLGEFLNFKLHISTFSEKERSIIKYISYAVLSKGKIIRAGRVNTENQDMTNLALPVSSEMQPSFRFVAYYLLPWQFKSEVVADSVLIEMDSHCVGALSVGPEQGHVSDSYSPGDTFRFQIRGDPGAKVSLVAVDNAVFLLSNSRLTQRKIWETVGRGDMGCSPGGGQDSMGVFKDAGLLFQSNYMQSSSSHDPCSWKPRTRRSTTRIHLRAELEKRYSDKLPQRCCIDGMRDIPMPYSCLRRSYYIVEGWTCVEAFLQCCSKFRGEVLGPITPPPPTTAEPTTAKLLPTFEYGFSGPRLPHPGLRIYMNARGREMARFGQPHYPIDAILRGEAGIPGLPGLPGSALIPLSSYPSGPMGAAGRIEGTESQTLPENRPLAEDFDEEEYAEVDDIYVRTKFYESWLWTDVRLPDVAGPLVRDGLATLKVDHVLPDSITQWGILGISGSPEKGFCVAEPYNIKAWKRFFVDLKVPRTAARNEHVEVKAVLHNYMNEDLEVMVILEKTEDMCSVAFTGAHRQKASVRARSSFVLRYTVIPLHAGELPLQVTATARHFSGEDAIRKNLKVVVEGIQKLHVRSYILNPDENGDADGKQLINVKQSKLSNVVPNSLPETHVNIRGNVLSDSIDNSINQDSLATLIRMPGGCVEQNLASFTLPLIATQYLDRSKQWESVGMERRMEAIGYIQKGYTNQLNFQRSDDSYPPYRREGASTWITAFVVKVFSMSNSFITIKEQHICGPLRYLLKNKQLSSGAFKEDNPVSATYMMGGVYGGESRQTLTAFVLIALAEAQSFSCSNAEINTEVAYRRAGEYLKENFPKLSRPYSVAIACYALAVSNQGCQKSLLMKAASPDRTHWPDSDNKFYTLEATGYALLALLKGGHLSEADAPFKWLNEQRGVGGGFGSTQSTLVVLQALSEYLLRKPPSSELSLQVELAVPGRSDTRWAFTSRLAHVARSSRVPLDQDFTVMATGKGQGILEIVTVYNELPDAYEKSSCNGFELDVSISESSEKPPPDVEKYYNLTINVRALEPRQVRMAVLDISLPTGFEPEYSDLEQLSNSVDRYINNFQVVDNLSDRGSLIIHLFKVSNIETDIITFRLQQKFKVGLLQPSTVTVYQYYNKDKSCIRFYTPPEDKEQLSQICNDNICRCTQGDCCVTKTESHAISVSDRQKFVCNGLRHAFKVQLLSVNASQYDRYEMKILQVIKEGSEIGLKQDDTRVFLSHANCREGLHLVDGQDYLIIGPHSDVWTSGSANDGYSYVLGKETWLERWPSQAECESQGSARIACENLDAFAMAFINKGCQT